MAARLSMSLSKDPIHKLRAVGPSGVHMVVDEDVMVLRFMRRALLLSLDRFFTQFLVF